MKRLELSSLTAPHTTMTEDMKLSYCTAEAWYKKTDGKVFGVIKIYWEFSSPLHKKKKCCDDAYLLFSSDGSYRRVEYEEFNNIIGANDYYYYPIEYNVWSS